MKKIFISIITFLVYSVSFGQQLQQRDPNPVDLDSINIDTYSEQPGLLIDKDPIFKWKNSDFKTYISKHLIYPEEARSKLIEGGVYVSYIIGIDGKVKNVKVIQSSNPALDEAAINVVAHSPKWKPARYKGKPVAFKKISKVVFSL